MTQRAKTTAASTAGSFAAHERSDSEAALETPRPVDWARAAHDELDGAVSHAIENDETVMVETPWGRLKVTQLTSSSAAIFVSGARFDGKYGHDRGVMISSLDSEDSRQQRFALMAKRARAKQQNDELIRAERDAFERGEEVVRRAKL